MLDRIALLLFLALSFLYSPFAAAECGGQTQCIGIGVTPADALQAHHGGANKTPTIDYGSQAVGVPDSFNGRTIYVEAVTGPAGTQVTLGALFIDGVDSSDFSITGGTCSTTNGPIHGGQNCTIEVEFNPSSIGSKTATLHVPLNPPACPTCITERTAILTGTGGEADPNWVPDVRGLIEAQLSAARRFASTQMINVHQRLRAIHQRNGKSIQSASLAEYPDGEQADALSEEQIKTYIETADASIWSKSDRQTIAMDLSPTLDTDDFTYWVNGSLRLGGADDFGLNLFTYNTNGISLGIDRNFSEDLTLGAGFGFAKDNSEIGSNGSVSGAQATSFFVYGSYEPSEQLFLDAMIGYSDLNYDVARYIQPLSVFYNGSRSGDQLFGSVSLGYNFGDESFYLAPYLRVDYSTSTLEQYTEAAASQYALTFASQQTESTDVKVGFDYGSAHEVDFGIVKPRLSAEYAFVSIGDEDAGVMYSDMVSGINYSVTNLITDSSYMIGIGSDFVFLDAGSTLALDYRFTQFSGSGGEYDNFIGTKFSQALDAKYIEPIRLPSATFQNPLQVEYSITSIDNVNRAPSNESLYDVVSNIKVSTSRIYSLGWNSRALVTGTFDFDRYVNYEKLSSIGLGLKGELQYRTSRAFDAYTLGLLLDLHLEDSSSSLRDGYTTKFGITMRQSLSDRIGMYIALLHDSRNTKGGTIGQPHVGEFDESGTSLIAFFDYALKDKDTLYLGLQLRDGDVVITTSSVSYFAPYANQIGVSFDDAFSAHGFNGQGVRLDATTNILTLGYNWSLGPRDSIDFSWSYINSDPDASVSSYTVNQASAAYIMRF